MEVFYNIYKNFLNIKILILPLTLTYLQIKFY